MTSERTAIVFCIIFIYRKHWDTEELWCGFGKGMQFGLQQADSYHNTKLVNVWLIQRCVDDHDDSRNWRITTVR